jgi:hypothetical protein
MTMQVFEKIFIWSFFSFKNADKVFEILGAKIANLLIMMNNSFHNIEKSKILYKLKHIIKGYSK